MKITPRYKQLYEKALDVEKRSRSPRIRAIHNSGAHCQVCLGVTDPANTKYIFVGLNPGGAIITKDPQIPATLLSMADYVDSERQPYRYQKNVRTVIEAFAKRADMSLENAIPLFGAVNLSFLHSGNVDDRISYNIEVSECLEVVQQEIDLPKLETLVFTGRKTPLLFKRSLWQSGAAMTPVSTLSLTNVDPKATAFRTSLITGKSATCLFTRHLSPRGPLPTTFLAELGRWISKFGSRS